MSNNQIDTWTSFYGELSSKLEQYQNKRVDLARHITNIYASLKEQNWEGTDESRHIQGDIDPFTVFNLFNGSKAMKTRKQFMGALRQELGLKAKVPESLNGIPIRHIGVPTFYNDQHQRRSWEIDQLWHLFTVARKLSSGAHRTDTQVEEFIQAFNDVKRINRMGWNLSTGLSWIQPYYFISLNQYNRKFILSERNGFDEAAKRIRDWGNVPDGPDGKQYLAFRDDCAKTIEKVPNRYSNFADLTYQAWKAHVSPHKSQLSEPHQSASWIPFYEELADKLLPFHSNRGTFSTAGSLLGHIRHAFDTLQEGGIGLPKLENDWNPTDIDPFTVFGTFNKKLSESHQWMIAEAYKKEFGVKADVPQSFEGIPKTSNQQATFYLFQDTRPQNEIDSFWELFQRGIELARNNDEVSRSAFIEAYDSARIFRLIKWRLTIGLYWIRPNTFVSLDDKTRNSIENGSLGPECSRLIRSWNGARPTGEQYLELCEASQKVINSDVSKYSSFSDVVGEAYEASRHKSSDTSTGAETFSDGAMSTDDGDGGVPIADGSIGAESAESSNPNGKGGKGPIDIDEDGTDEQDRVVNPMVDDIVDLLTKHNFPNIILHGAPGTGKTYLAKQAAAKIIKVDDIRALAETQQFGFVQFHPSYDYTDFVEGLRPVISSTSQSGFELRPGVFMKFVDQARKDEDNPYVFIIDEINRGNISRIFGELFFTLDPGYRGPKGRVKTQYANLHDDCRKAKASYQFNEWFWIPKNVYILGTMNDIDRSTENIDFAMRRRFRFKQVDAESSRFMLEPDEQDEDQTVTRKKQALAGMNALNHKIETQPGLGRSYCLGAGYFKGVAAGDEEFDDLWHYALEPLLKDYLYGVAAEGVLQEFHSEYLSAVNSAKQ
ncbi:AAA family ATPase [Bifidobacterium sp. ESL0704]|uniref:McrB family protein n=1 Tax=Bifidobacterium sp. ESL0704 TaxID=2983219 RepID=UPI0023F9084D|nr:AAA family ATPase [Bifidobacterium sp. ESL0704]WEV53029.1 AAA family ATPase [Bifidobacterium sp. ESL0704]